MKGVFFAENKREGKEGEKKKNTLMIHYITI
jgi:hypothetical protein